MAASLSFDAAYRRIRRGELAPVYYLTGSQEVLKDELVDLIVAVAVEPSTLDFNLDVRVAGDVDAENFTALVETPPMLAERRVVVIRSIDQWRKNSKVWQFVEQYVSRPSAMTILILSHGAGEKPLAAIARHACQVAVDDLSPERLAKWVKVRGERIGVEIEPEAAAHLVEAVGPDLAQLGMELEKLAAAAVTGTVDTNQVAELVGVRRGETSYDWVGAVLTRNAPRAIDILPTVLGMSGTTGVRLVTILGTALVLVKLARTLLDSGLPPDRVERELLRRFRAARLWMIQDWKRAAAEWTSTARAWRAADLDSAIRVVLDTDRALKSTTVADETALVTDMVLRMSARKAAA